MKDGFSLIELLVVIFMVAVLTAVLMPALSRARVQAKVAAVNAELYGISIALESYYVDNENKYPPTRADCNPDARRHAYALPQELVDSGYLPKGQLGRICFADIEDKFNLGCAYKYMAVGPKYDYLGVPFGNQHLYIPKGFPDRGNGELIKYDGPLSSPVTWVLFSLGPRYPKERLEQGDFPIKQGFPVAWEFRFNPKECKGVIIRLRLRNGRHMGSFEGG